MPRGPAGGPRPAATSSLNVKIEMNDTDKDVGESLIKGMTQRFRRIDSISVTEDTEMGFERVVIELLLRNNDIMLASVEDLVTDIENSLDTERITVTIEAV